MMLPNTCSISLYDRSKDKYVYSTFVEGNTKYLEREDEVKFNILSLVTDVDNGTFCYKINDLQNLLQDLFNILEEINNNDTIMMDHIKEIIMMVKMCLWNIKTKDESNFLILFSFTTDINYPEFIPMNIRYSIANLKG